MFITELFDPPERCVLQTMVELCEEYNTDDLFVSDIFQRYTGKDAKSNDELIEFYERELKDYFKARIEQTIKLKGVKGNKKVERGFTDSCIFCGVMWHSEGECLGDYLIEAINVSGLKELLCIGSERQVYESEYKKKTEKWQSERRMYLDPNEIKNVLNI